MGALYLATTATAAVICMDVEYIVLGLLQWMCHLLCLTFVESWETGLSGQNAGSENREAYRVRFQIFVCRKIGHQEWET